MLSLWRHPTAAGMPLPYPAQWIHTVTLRDGALITLRPIRPDDAAIEAAFVREMSDESRYFRFMDHLRELPPRMLSHFIDVDYYDHMAVIATTMTGDGVEQQIGVARYIVIPDTAKCEFAVAVADAWQRRGVATHLMRLLIDAARARGLTSLYGEVLPSNSKMLALMQNLGFTASFDLGGTNMMRVEKVLA